MRCTGVTSLAAAAALCLLLPVRVSGKGRHRLDLVHLDHGPGLRVLRTERAWGNRLLVRGLRRVAALYRRQFPAAPPLWVHDISRAGGGRIPGHRSHRTGRDADIRLPQRDPDAGYVDVSPEALHLERTWFLVLALVGTCDVEMIFVDRELQHALYEHGRRRGVWRRHLKWLLQYPFRRASGVVRHRDHHKNHMHVRFRQPGVALDLMGANRLCDPEPDGRRLVHRLLTEQVVHLMVMGGDG